jgi:hypothetical protein
MTKLWAWTGPVLVVATLSGCHSSTSPIAPSPPGPPAMTTPPRPQVPVPPLLGPFAIYAFKEPLTNFGQVRVTPATERSRFVLYDIGAFYLEYETLAGRAYGRCVRDGSRIDFHFGTVDDGVDAVGTMVGDHLEVRYGLLMLHSDFEDAIYHKVEPAEGLAPASSPSSGERAP